MRYSNPENTMVFVESSRVTWERDPHDCFLPVELLATRGLNISDVLPYEAPPPEPQPLSRAERLEIALVAKGIFTKEEIAAILGD